MPKRISTGNAFPWVKYKLYQLFDEMIRTPWILRNFIFTSCSLEYNRPILLWLSWVYSMDGDELLNNTRQFLCLMKIQNIDFSGHFKDLSNCFEE